MFSEVLRSGRRVTSGPLSLCAQIHGEGAVQGTLRFGVSIGKRVAPSAVVRNRVKRLLRAALRQCIPGAAEHIEARRITSVVLLWKVAPSRASDIGLRDVLPHVENAVRQLITVCRPLP